VSGGWEQFEGGAVCWTERAEVAVVQSRDPSRAQTLGYCHHRRIRSAQGEISLGAHQAGHTAQVDEGDRLKLELTRRERI
jgi:hypothetical protein